MAQSPKNGLYGSLNKRPSLGLCHRTSEATIADPSTILPPLSSSAAPETDAIYANDSWLSTQKRIRLSDINRFLELRPYPGKPAGGKIEFPGDYNMVWPGEACGGF